MASHYWIALRAFRRKCSGSEALRVDRKVLIMPIRSSDLEPQTNINPETSRNDLCPGRNDVCPRVNGQLNAILIAGEDRLGN